MEAIGFGWGKPLGQSCRGIEGTAKYLKEHGTANAPRHYVTENGFRLGDWQANTRHMGRTGKLSEKHRIALEKMWFDFSIETKSATNHKMQRRPI